MPTCNLLSGETVSYGRFGAQWMPYETRHRLLVMIVCVAPATSRLQLWRGCGR